MNAPLKKAFSHFKNGDLENTQRCLNTALAQEPHNADAWHLRGVLALNAMQVSDAIAAIERACALKPSDHSMRINLVAAYNAARRFDDALKAVAPALAAPQPMAEAYYQAGLSHRNLRQVPETIAALSKCVAMRPDWVNALEILADSLSHTGEIEKSVQHALHALEIDPNLPMCHRVIGDAYMRWLRYDEALVRYRRAVELAPEDGGIRNNYALLLTRMGLNAEAIPEYEAAMKLTPKNLPAWEGYAMGQLAEGRFREGWPHYAARIKAAGAIWAVRPGPPPATDPSQLAGKPILAWLDQGIGDQILFSSLIPDLIKTGADLTIECDTRLIPLLKRIFPQLPMRPLNDAPTAADNDGFAHQVYVPDSARWFRTSFDDFPRLPGYLKADPQLTQKLRADYLRISEGRPIIGISWRTAANTKISDHKTIELEAWAPLLAQQATFVSLQYGDCRYELGRAVEKLGRPIVFDDSVDAVKDMDACAAQVAAMDLVITTSNATAHVAGSLNVPVWTLIPKGYGLIWHWFLNREDSPWYPSMRLLRQVKQGDWGPVLERAATMLASFIAAGRS